MCLEPTASFLAFKTIPFRHTNCVKCKLSAREREGGFSLITVTCEISEAQAYMHIHIQTRVRATSISTGITLL